MYAVTQVDGNGNGSSNGSSKNRASKKSRNQKAVDIVAIKQWLTDADQATLSYIPSSTQIPLCVVEVDESTAFPDAQAGYSTINLRMQIVQIHGQQGEPTSYIVELTTPGNRAPLVQAIKPKGSALETYSLDDAVGTALLLAIRHSHSVPTLDESGVKTLSEMGADVPQLMLKAMFALQSDRIKLQQQLLEAKSGPTPTDLEDWSEPSVSLDGTSPEEPVLEETDPDLSLEEILDLS